MRSDAIDNLLSPRAHSIATLILTLACLILFLPGFFSIPPTDRDESRFAQATKQMVASGDYINIRFQDIARNKKPIGIYWLQAAAVKLSMLGEKATIWVYRTPSLLGAIGGVLLTYWALLALMPREDAFLAALLFATCVLVGVEARLAKTDAVLLAACVASMGALLRLYLGQIKKSTPYIFWLALACGVLVKGPVILLITGGAVLFLSIYRCSARWIMRLRPLSGFTLLLILVLPWFLSIMAETEGAFLTESIGADMFSKITSAQESHGAPPGAYFALLWLTFIPASLFLAAVMPSLHRFWREKNIVVLLAWIIPAWLAFELIPTKLPHYVLPLYPALAGLTVIGLQKYSFALQGKWHHLWMSAFLWIPAALLLAGAIMLYQREHYLDITALALILPTIFFGVLAFRTGRENARAAVLFSCAAMACVYFGIYERILPRWSEIWLSPRLAMEISRVVPCPSPELASAGYHEPSLVFLTRGDIKLVDSSGAAEFLKGKGCRIALIDEALDGHSTKTGITDFQAALKARGLVAKRLSLIEGRNVNGGHLRRIGLWQKR